MKVSQFIATLLFLLVLLVFVQAQFFTKTSKSIPRMGRRADTSLLSIRDPMENVSDQSAYWPTSTTMQSSTVRPNSVSWVRLFSTLFHLPRSWYNTEEQSN